MARVLIVDDDDQVRAVFRRALEGGGYEVTDASDGKAGSRLYRQQPADLILMDIIMPEQEGLETIQELRGDFPDVKIIAISGGGRGGAADYLVLARKLGADLALEKPISHEDLLRAVDQLLKKGNRPASDPLGSSR
jgi:CheY-like chemotaxis protein